MRSRQETLEYLRREPKPAVLILGAGVNGIGTFRDLALQGVEVLMVDRGDFCCGASAASSHMVHGGIRYLENGEFRLVREAVRERNRLLQNAPHAVHPLPTVFPVFKILSGLLNAPLKFLGLRHRPAERGALVIKIGMTLYDAYTGGDQAVPRHQFLNRRQALARFPRLNPKVRYAGVYYDAAMPSPERICMDLIQDAQSASPRAWALNYTSAVGAQGDQVLLREALSGETYGVRPRVVINAAGPWIDFVNRALGRPTHFIGGTKGSHLVLHHPELRAALQDHEFFFENRDGRIVLIFPLLDKVLVGTTDVRIDDPDQARCTEEEIDYFFGMVDRVFPGMELERSHIVYKFSGVRPLPYAKVGFTGQISRDHKIEVVDPVSERPFPIFNLIGGKWTTFRAFAEQVADRALEHLGLPRRASTRDLPIGGGRDFPREPAARDAWIQEVAQESGLPPRRLDVLLERYGTRARDLAAFLAKNGDEPLPSAPDYSRQEVAHLAQGEAVVHLDDLVLRRTLIGKLGRLTPELARELAAAAGGALGWDAQRQRQEAQRALKAVREG
jgi:glycerol-3-phosphate dehydrogenase